jgi:phage gpG-like protein
MIVETEISGTLPTLKEDDLQSLGERNADFLLDEVRLNFFYGGRPKWMALELGKGPPSYLFDTGALLQSIEKKGVEIKGDTVESTVGTTGGLPYAWIHQEGGWTGRKGTSWIEPRPYAALPPESIQKLIEMNAGYIVTILNHKGEPIGKD